jgi:hypothetical protein
MVGCVKAGALENDSDRLVDFLQTLFSALGTAGKRLVIEGLVFIELHSTVGTPISVNWHALIFFQKRWLPGRDYSALMGLPQEVVLFQFTLGLL